MKNITFTIIFSFLGQFLMVQCLDIRIENQQVVQGSLYFDIYLYNALGQKIPISFKSLNDDQLILDLKGLPTGVYVLEMQKDGAIVARKFVLGDWVGI